MTEASFALSVKFRDGQINQSLLPNTRPIAHGLGETVSGNQIPQLTHPPGVLKGLPGGGLQMVLQLVVLVVGTLMSNVTDMSSMFERVTSFNGDLSKWNFSSVIIMSHMFNCTLVLQVSE